MGQKLYRKAGQKLAHPEKCEHWNRLPDSVLFDPRLTASAKCVYAVLAGSVHQGTVATMGARLIAKKLKASRTTVRAAVEELTKYEHIVPSGKGNERTRYHLNSDVFGQKQRDGEESVVVEGIVSGPRRRLATVRVDKTA